MIYDTVKAVLSDLDAQGAADHDDWEEQVAARLAALEAGYAILRQPERELIDYSELATQAAYVFRYVLPHAEFIYDFLKIAREKIGAPLFGDTVLTVTSVGGGPGSELLGLVKYLSEENDEPEVTKIIYTVIDKESNWEHVIEAFASEVETDIEIEVEFQTCDVSAANVPDGVTLEQEDVVFMSFFISEVCALPENDRVCANLRSIFQSLPTGSLMIYKDSDAFSFYKFFNLRIGAAKKYKELLDIKGEYKIDAPDYDGVFAEYVEQYNYRPKLSSKAVSKVLRRI